MEGMNPLVERYASREMIDNFSALRKFRLWRGLWIALAEAQKELGLPITDEQIEEMRSHKDDIDLERAKELERKFRHDVVAHIHLFGELCPRARPIIHLGATSAFVGDNTDLIQIRDGLMIIERRLLTLITVLRELALRERSTYCLGYTHLQPAQPVTLGKRVCLWLQDFISDFEEVTGRLQDLRFRGAKGTTGTQASFLELFNGDHEKVKNLDQSVAQKMGFTSTFPVTGQTYPRKTDWLILSALASTALSAHKMANDIRLLQSMGEVEEPFGETQIGSSAMPYKRNPMRSERVCSLSRFLISLLETSASNSSLQWLERTLDDSANRRLIIPQSFMCADAVLLICINVAEGLKVNRGIIEFNLHRQLPFLASEAILMEAVKRGGDRQTLHQRLRRHSMAVVEQMRKGGANTLLEKLREDPAFASIRDELEHLADPARLAGRAPQQVEDFITEVVDPVLKKYGKARVTRIDLRV